MTVRWAAQRGKVKVGDRIRVTRVAESGAERRGVLFDAARLLGQTGTVNFINGGQGFAQLGVAWDNSRPGTLMLASEDEFEVLP